MTTHKSIWIWVVVVVALVSIGLNIWHWSGKAESGQTAHADELYTCPMHPQVVQDHPGDCPICGMKLVKKMVSPAADEQTDSLAATVNLSPTQEVLANVATEKIGEASFQAGFSVPGTIAAVEGNQVKVTTQAMGQIKKLYVNFAGASVKKGQPLYDFYSPDIAAAEREMLLVRSTTDPVIQDNLMLANHEKLASLGLSAEQILEIHRSGQARDLITFKSPISGVVMAKMAIEGDWVMGGMNLFEIVDLSQVWVEGVLYEQNVQQVQLGYEMAVSVDALPGETFHGKVSWLAPMVDMMTRTLPFRVTLPNPNGKLKPGTFVRIHLRQKEGFTALSVPESAVLKTGRMTMVWVKVGPGRYNPREVQVGERVNGRYPVISGLNPGDEVVVQGGYLIDSDAQLRSMGGGMGNMPGMQHGSDKGDQSMPGMEMPSQSQSPTVTAPQVKPAEQVAQDVYTCPMHPEVVSDKPSKCPKCGMNLEKKQ